MTRGKWGWHRAQGDEGVLLDTKDRAGVRVLKVGCDMAVPMSCHRWHVSKGRGAVASTGVREVQGVARE